MSFPILIASKGRADNIKTLTHFPDAIILVEPQELEEYKKHSKNVVSIEQNDQGIAYVRNFALQFARKNNYDWFWMMDDDIRAFVMHNNGKAVRVSGKKAIDWSEKALLQTKGVGQAALEYSQYVWSSKGGFSWNSYCDVCVCINVELTKDLEYDRNVNLKEDRDFTIQVLKKGHTTLRIQTFGFECPENGSNKGGLQEVYAQPDNEKEAVIKMCKKHPDCISSQEKNTGRIDCKIDWKFFKLTNTDKHG
jgi:glycosyltransferase involved in cell wall biosynthesis